MELKNYEGLLASSNPNIDLSRVRKILTKQKHVEQAQRFQYKTTRANSYPELRWSTSILVVCWSVGRDYPEGPVSPPGSPEGWRLYV